MANMTTAELLRQGVRIRGQGAGAYKPPPAIAAVYAHHGLPAPARPKPVRAFVPGRFVSEANAGGKRRDAIRRKTEIKEAARYAFANKLRPYFVSPRRVRFTLLTRAPQDGDNLQRTFKTLRDWVALALGFDDAADVWEYAQAPQRPFECRGAWVEIFW